MAQWAFQRPPLPREWVQARQNAVRFRYYAEVYRFVYEGFTP